MLPALLLLVGCQEKKKDTAPETAGQSADSVMGAAHLTEDVRVKELNQWVKAVDAAPKTVRSVSPFRMLDVVGKVEGHYEGASLQVLHTELKSSDGLRDIQEWIYVDASGKPLVYRELVRFARCSPQEPAPCVRESWIYLDEAGQPIVSRQRTRVMQDAADIAMEGQALEDYTPETGTDARIAQEAARYRMALLQPVASGTAKAPERAQADGQRIYFNGDATLLKGALEGSTTKDYLLRLREAQPAAIRLQSTVGCTMEVSDMDGKVLLRNGTEWIGSAPRAGDMHVRVQCIKTAASYTISVEEY